VFCVCVCVSLQIFLSFPFALRVLEEKGHVIFTFVGLVSFDSSTKFGECLLPFGSESFIIPPLSRNVKVKIYETVILPFVLYG
jgi:hypothetical protein